MTVDPQMIQWIVTAALGLYTAWLHYRQSKSPSPTPSPDPAPSPGPVAPHLGDGHILAVLLQLLAQLQQPGGPLAPPPPKV